jgi:hypothetical protein
MTVFSPHVRGPMRIEVGSNILGVSGDIYVQRRFSFPPPIEVERPPFIPIPDPGPLGEPAGPLVSPAGAVGTAPSDPDLPVVPHGPVLLILPLHRRHLKLHHRPARLQPGPPPVGQDQPGVH